MEDYSVKKNWISVFSPGHFGYRRMNHGYISRQDWIKTGLDKKIVILKTSFIFLLLGTGTFLVLFYIYPIVPNAPAFLHSSRYNLKAWRKYL